ncbi:hypothetical protein K437DRAFT_192920 [Tilletiaria anomala UBC 951]|uniref:Secreted protein n=1 Tax=Tilletiaria anomala (strain ATCC 24038 / CBS 436.72 / UBC 951) TaxID=1037660 RepID=A0A066VMN0_TILAU|nr:uncharacterized protein K437DRAFT_192920 [Tilletiaria anomala UBC 951]KDN40024.1 hypothetical protein K437DRAFT_192920 [Tilletiaria anomala UBC 951]
MRRKWSALHIDLTFHSFVAVFVDMSSTSLSLCPSLQWGESELTPARTITSSRISPLSAKRSPASPPSRRRGHKSNTYMHPPCVSVARLATRTMDARTSLPSGIRRSNGVLMSSPKLQLLAGPVGSGSKWNRRG